MEKLGKQGDQIARKMKKLAEQAKRLLEKNRNTNLSTDENYELDRLLALDHLIALAKAHARIQLSAA